MRKYSLALLLAAPVAGALVLATALGLLDKNASYRSPFRGTAEARTPRDRALADLEAWREKKEQEAAERARFLASLDTEKMVELGKEIVAGKGLCFVCHMVGPEGFATSGPDLAGVGERAGSRVPGMTDVEYLAESLYQPKAFVLPGFEQEMPSVRDPGIALDDLEVLMVIAYLQSLGGAPTVKPDTEVTQYR